MRNLWKECLRKIDFPRNIQIVGVKNPNEKKITEDVLENTFSYPMAIVFFISNGY